MDEEIAPRRFPRPWLFAFASMPYGCFNGLVAVALPYILRHRGLSVDAIASISARVQIPSIAYFLWAPMVDLKLRRRTWVMALSIASGLCAAAALAADATQVAALAWLLVVASVLNQPISSAIGGLVPVVVPDRYRGRTGGWSQAGILAGGIGTGGIAIWLTDHAATPVLATVVCVIIAIPAFAVLGVNEPRTNRGDRREYFRRMLRETTALLRRRDVWFGFAFFLSPIGAGALVNLFAAVGEDFHASPNFVLLGVSVAGVLTPIGALIGGVLCDRFDRRIVYAIGGLLAALSVAGILAAPLSPITYLVGASTYAIATGFAYATFMALALALLGEGSAASGTQFTLFMAAVNIPVVYMLRLDGIAHAHYGVRGMLLFDGLANLVFGAALLVASVSAFYASGRNATLAARRG